jgi:hypothetical protein
MTTCATENATVRRAGFTIAADGSYAACLTQAGDGWYPERWTLDSTEPYIVPLPANQPEEPDSQVLPLPDGRVLIRRRVADRYDLALLYPTGPGTGELWLGSLRGEDVRLMPAPPAGSSLFATAYEGGTTSVWMLHGDGELCRVAMVPGRCAGGAWLDRTGRLLGLDRVADGRTKAVAVDLRHGEVSPLLQITEDSNDRLLFAEPDSGLLVVRSDAPGEDRLGWGVLGSHQPVRFAECLRVPDTTLTPFAAQPGQMLMPEECAVALRAESTGGTSLAVWRPGERRVTWLSAPEGWLAGAGLWSMRGVLRLPYACEHCACGLAEYEAPAPSRAVASVAPVSEVPEPSSNEQLPSPVLPLREAPLAAVSPVPRMAQMVPVAAGSSR